MYCEQCQNEYPDDRKFCPQCGVLLKAQTATSADKTVSCPSCGKETQPGKKFCVYCGSRIMGGPRLCPACGAIAPAEAQFCGDCGAPLIRSGTATLEPVKTAELDVTERLGNSTDGELVLAEAGTLPLLPARPRQRAADDSTDTLGQTLGWKDTFLKWLRMPGLRISVQVSFLMLLALFFYRLGSQQQTQVGSELTQTSKQAPSVSPPPEPDAEVAAEVPVQTPSASPSPEPKNGEVKQEESKIAAPNPEAVPPPLLPSPPSVTEQPLSSPRFYRVTTPTALRDKPTWTGKEVAQLQSNTLIEVVATVGDWLKVESKSTPPKPPGYVWKEDAKLE